MHKSKISNIARSIILMSTLSAVAPLSYAEDFANEFSNAIHSGKTSLDFRLRYENAAQHGLQDAHATTLRTQLGFESGEFCDSKLKLELVDVTALFGQRYNPGVSDLYKPQYASIADPRGAGISAGNISYNGIDKNEIIFGRQYLALGNQRFIGANDFRQFPQTFDALSIKNTLIDNSEISYTFINNINSNFGNGRGFESRRNLSTHLVSFRWNGFDFGKVIAYALFNRDRTVHSNSHTLFGVRATELPNHDAFGDDFSFELELARQKGRFNNPNHYGANYFQASATKTIEPFAGTVGYEYLGGNFNTSLGSNANFNGAAQAFVPIPTRGLQDVYARISGGTTNVTVHATYHLFRFAKGPGSKKAGQEIDLGIDLELNKQFDLSMMFAKYNPKNAAALSTRRFWIALRANLL